MTRRRESLLAGRRRRRSWRRAGAFSLIEVLVALAIFAMGAVLLASSYINVLFAYGAAANVDSYEDDLRTVRQLVLEEPDPELLEQGGDVELPGDRHASWNVTLEPTETVDLHRVLLEVEISGGELKEAVHVTQEFQVLRPTWSDATERSRLLAEAQSRITEINQARRP